MSRFTDAVNVLLGRSAVQQIDESVVEPEMVGEATGRVIQEYISINEDNSNFSMGQIQGITEDVLYHSPQDILKFLESNEIDMRKFLESLRQDYTAADNYKENEEMAKDSIVGSAMEMMADDSCLRSPTTGKLVSIESDNASLAEFLNGFLKDSIRIESRLWEWAYEIVKHGDFKLRRREYITNDGQNGVYYENEMEGYKVSRIEYLGEILGFLDESEGDQKSLEPPDSFVHFMSTKLPKKSKIKVKIKQAGINNADDAVNKSKGNGSGVTDISKSTTAKDSKKEEKELAREITCYKVSGSCLVDNARFIFRVIRLLDDMLIMSRVARSTQFNIIKVEVGNAGPAETQRILMDVRRRIEGSTRMSKGRGMRSDPSPIPVNSNIYLPTREGKGDIVVDSVNESVDVKSITDIDYFRNKEFATIKVPKPFLGFEEAMPASFGNTSLTKLDQRYARTVQRVLNIIKSGLTELCNNYLRYRGRDADVGKFNVIMRNITSAEDSGLIDDLVNHVSLLESFGSLFETYEGFLDKGKVLVYLLKTIDMDVTQIGTDELIKILDGIKAEKEAASVNNKEFGTKRVVKG